MGVCSVVGFVFCLGCCFGSVFVFELSHSLLFTQKLWRFSGLSERALDLLLGLGLGVPSISRLFNLDCRYPRDQLQPARKKKKVTDPTVFVTLAQPHPNFFCFVNAARLQAPEVYVVEAIAYRRTIQLGRLPIVCQKSWPSKQLRPDTEFNIASA